MIVDDHDAVRAGVRLVLNPAVKAGMLSVVGLAADGDEAIEQADQHNPQVIVLDYRMPAGSVDGTDLISVLRERSPASRIVIYTGITEFRLAHRVLEAGATAVVSKSDSSENLTRAIVSAARNKPFLSPQFAHDADAEALDLTPRQLTVIRYSAVGLTVEQMAERMGIGNETVRHHLKAAMGRLRVSSRAHLVGRAMWSGLLPEDEAAAGGAENADTPED